MGYLRGRENRATYWLGLGFLASLLVLLAVFAPSEARVSEGLLIVLAIPRLHDINRSGWWAIIAFASELTGMIAAAIALDRASGSVAMGLLTLLVFVAMVWLGIVPGDVKANRFGEVPAPGLAFRSKLNRS